MDSYRNCAEQTNQTWISTTTSKDLSYHGLTNYWNCWNWQTKRSSQLSLEKKKERTIVYVVNRKDCLRILRVKKELKSLDPTELYFLEKTKVFVNESLCNLYLYFLREENWQIVLWFNYLNLHTQCNKMTLFKSLSKCSV